MRHIVREITVDFVRKASLSATIRGSGSMSDTSGLLLISIANLVLHPAHRPGTSTSAQKPHSQSGKTRETSARSKFTRKLEPKDDVFISDLAGRPEIPHSVSNFSKLPHLGSSPFTEKESKTRPLSEGSEVITQERSFPQLNRSQSKSSMSGSDTLPKDDLYTWQESQELQELQELQNDYESDESGQDSQNVDCDAKIGQENAPFSHRQHPKTAPFKNHAKLSSKTKALYSSGKMRAKSSHSSQTPKEPGRNKYKTRAVHSASTPSLTPLACAMANKATSIVKHNPHTGHKGYEGHTGWVNETDTEIEPESHGVFEDTREVEVEVDLNWTKKIEKHVESLESERDELKATIKRLESALDALGAKAEEAATIESRHSFHSFDPSENLELKAQIDSLKKQLEESSKKEEKALESMELYREQVAEMEQGMKTLNQQIASVNIEWGKKFQIQVCLIKKGGGEKKWQQRDFNSRRSE